MYKFVRSIFFLFDPEKIHHFVFKLTRFSLKVPGMKWIWKKAYVIEDKSLERELFGLKFKNPVGLAAGFDKDGKLYNELEHCGFGFVEVGTVTPNAQAGNPKKRLFRLKQDKALINRMGFNNGGVNVLVSQLKKRRTKMIIGGNIGKNTDTQPEDYTKDYVACFKELHPHVDYFALNVSCPNVGSHAKLQDKDYLLELVGTLQGLNRTFKIQRPILLKIAPDLNKIQLDEIIELMIETKLEGVISTNTTVSREGLLTPNLETIGNGGLSGKPLAQRSTEVIKYLADKSNKAFPIIGVGGIHSEQDALEKIAAGADLVQIYTGFIYEGPGLVKRINKSILKGS